MCLCRSMVQVFEIIGAGEGNRTLDTQLGKLLHVVEFISFFCKPGQFVGHTCQWLSHRAANRAGDNCAPDKPQAPALSHIGIEGSPAAIYTEQASYCR